MKLALILLAAGVALGDTQKSCSQASGGVSSHLVLHADSVCCTQFGGFPTVDGCYVKRKRAKADTFLECCSKVLQNPYAAV